MSQFYEHDITRVCEGMRLPAGICGCRSAISSSYNTYKHNHRPINTHSVSEYELKITRSALIGQRKPCTTGTTNLMESQTHTLEHGPWMVSQLIAKAVATFQLYSTTHQTRHQRECAVSVSVRKSVRDRTRYRDAERRADTKRSR